MTMYATKIRMQPGCHYSNKLEEIDLIYIEGCDKPDFFKKAILHDFLKDHPGSILVKKPPYPKVIPAKSIHGEKYVRSTPNSYMHDNLLDLPRQ